MGVDLGGVQILMTQDILYGFHIHSAGEHKGRSSVAELVGRELVCIQSGLGQRLLDETMHRGYADAFTVPGAKQSAIITELFFVAFDEVIVDGFPAGVPK